MSFPTDQRFTVLDFETFSEADLKKVGSWEYGAHKSTEVLCVAWRTGTVATLPTASTYFWAPNLPTANVRFLWEAMRDPKMIFVAHNALFEQAITHGVCTRLWRSQAESIATLTPERWVCTAALAAALAVPRKLEHAANVLKLKARKDMDGNRLILKWCKPRKPTKNNPSTRHTDKDELKRIVDYCVSDIEVETELFLTVPPLSPEERRIWILDQTINLRGFQVDRALVKTTLDMIATEVTHLDARTDELSFGAISTTNKRAALKAWLEAEGTFLPDLQKKTIEDALAAGMVTGAAKEMLEIRLAVSKTSTAKYEALEARSRFDGRVRDNLIYHGASTGRWSGAGVQVQNLPRGTIKDSGQAADIIAEGCLETVRLLYGQPMEVFSSCVRSAIVAPEGTILDAADFNAIEARVLFWLADHAKGLQAFRDGRDLYRELGAKIYRVVLDAVDERQRWVGKTATLGCGFGLGFRRFRDSALGFGQELTEEEAKAAVDAYREENAPVVALWKKYEMAALAAVNNLGKRYSIAHTTWYVRGDFLWCVLPSGRKLAYHKPYVQWEKPSWGGDKKPVVYHWGVNPTTKQWTPEKKWGGSWTENVTQAVARDLMAAAMLRIDATQWWKIVLSVHDELVAERSFLGEGSNKEYCELMAQVPPWGKGIPVRVAGFESKRYRK